MHKATIEVVDPDLVEVRLTCTAQVRTWRIVASVLSDAIGEQFDYQAREVLEAVMAAVEKVDDKFVGLGQANK